MVQCKVVKVGRLISCWGFVNIYGGCFFNVIDVIMVQVFVKFMQGLGI